MMVPQAGPEAAARLINFINASPTPFHAVATAALRLEKAGFRKVRLRTATHHRHSLFVIDFLILWN